MATKIKVGILYRQPNREKTLCPTGTIRKIKSLGEMKCKLVTISDYVPPKDEGWTWISRFGSGYNIGWINSDLANLECKEIWIRRGLYYDFRIYMKK